MESWKWWNCESRRCWAKKLKKREFTEEYAQLGIKEVVSNKSKLLQLSPHLEKEVFIHVGGHIKNAAIPDTAKTQIILSALSQYVTQCDEIYFVGLRQVYWILNSRTAIKKIAKLCLHCRKMKSKPVAPRMADLPNVWLDCKHPPFTNKAVTYFGPIFIKQHWSRLKRWGCLFVCIVTIAIHLELVESMDTDSFINVLKRFISRRGKHNTIKSGCGSNFKGAVKELKLEYSSLSQIKITKFTER